MSANSSWVFSDDLSPQALEQIQGLIAMNGLNSATAEQSAATPSDADAAFARMAAAFPNATIINDPASAGRPTTNAAAADEAFARMVAANPGATVIGDHAAAAQPAAIASAADVAAADAALAEIAAAHPGATVIRGPAGGGATLAVQSADAAAPSTWHFSADISPERRAELMAFVGAQQPAAPADEAAQAAAADAAFQSMVEAQPGAVEVAPGVFSIDESPTGEPLA